MRDHPREILVCREDEFPVLNGNGGNDEIRDANSEDALRVQAVPESDQVRPKTLALGCQWQRIEGPFPDRIRSITLGDDGHGSRACWLSGLKVMMGDDLAIVSVPPRLGPAGFVAAAGAPWAKLA